MAEQEILFWKNRVNQMMNTIIIMSYELEGEVVDPNEEFEVWRSMGSGRRCWIRGRVTCRELG